jgi:hypothetical protein
VVVSIISELHALMNDIPLDSSATDRSIFCSIHMPREIVLLIVSPMLVSSI